jgi:HlyD family secretion protein
MKRIFRGNLTPRKLLVALVLVTTALGGTIVYAQAAKSTTTYRTAQVTYGTITQSIGMAGNLQPLSQANLNFASAGTVQSVSVKVGQPVAVGATLAALDPTLLSAQVLQAQAALATADAKLAQDKAGATAQTLTSAQNSVAAAQVNVNNAQTSLTDTQAINAQPVAIAQAAATAAQALVTADQATTPASPSLTADQAALNVANNALAAAKAKAQQSNDQAAAALASAQQQLASAKSSLAALQTGTPASTLQMDEAQIEIAQVNVNTMQHQLDGATINSPIAGIVSQVNITAGQSVSGGSAGTGAASSYAVVVYSPGSYEVTGTVSDAQVNLVALGQAVEVTPAGSTQALQGKVTAISPAATVTSGVATFGVTAQLTDTSNSIKPGVSATATIVTNQVVHVLTVPTSAVHTSAAGSNVQILVNGKPQTVVVTTGASDPIRIQILSGLQLNQTVVIAVISSSVPSTGAGAALGTGGTRGGGGTRGPAAGG